MAVYHEGRSLKKKRRMSMKFCELMNVYDFTSPLFVIDEGKTVYNEIEDDLDPIFDFKIENGIKK